jgi:hypothetical protein
MPVEIAGVVLIALIMSIIESLKLADMIDRKYAALASIATGVVLMVGAQVAEIFGQRPLFEAIVQGIAAGLAASGLYSAGKAIARANPDTPPGPTATGHVSDYLP